MADGGCGSSQSGNKTSHTRSISLPNPLRLIQEMSDVAPRSRDDTDDRSYFLDNLIAIGQAAVEAATPASLQDDGAGTVSDEESSDGQHEMRLGREEGDARGDDNARDRQRADGMGNGNLDVDNPDEPSLAPEHAVVESDPDGVLNYSVVCPVCLENFYRPYSCHPCKHMFCEPCLCRMRLAKMEGVTRCPLCRQKIKRCTFDSALSSSIASSFPEVYQARHKAEKKQKHKLPPLPGIPISVDKYAKNMLATWSAVCLVVLLMMFVFAVFASLVGFVLWYTMEVMLDVIGELLIEVSDFFSFSWQALIILYIEGKVPQEIKEILTGSVGRISATMSRLVNRTKMFFTEGEVPPPPTMYVNFDDSTTRHKPLVMLNGSSATELLTKVTQVNVANYVFLAGLVTYILYRVARYFQNGNPPREVAILQ